MLKKFFIADPDHDRNTGHNLRKLIPNIITLLSMVCGLTSIQFAIDGAFHDAALLIIVATFLDMLDGAVARLLNATSKFGAELDSLADFLSFGVAPATLMYLWVLSDAGRVGWIAALLFTIACALRLARFNAQNEDPEAKPEWARYFFSGVPAPAGAGLMLLPMIFYFQINTDLSEFNPVTPLLGLWTLIIAGLMISKLPTFSSKQIRLPVGSMTLSLAIIGLGVAMLIHVPWMTLSVMGVLYLLSLPFSYRVYRAREKRSLITIEDTPPPPSIKPHA